MQNHQSNIPPMYSDLDKLQVSLLNNGYPLTSQYTKGIVGLAKKLSVKYGKGMLEHDFIQVALASAASMEPKYIPDTASFYTFINKPIKTAIQENFGNPNRQTKKYKLIHSYITEYDSTHGMYPDVETISTGTGLSRFDILSIYYDKYRTVQLDDVNEFTSEMQDPFAISDFSWIQEHLEALTKLERAVIAEVYENGISLAEAGRSMGLPTKEVIAIHSGAILKLKQSIEEYE